MNNNEQIAALLARFVAAETTEQEECLLAEYFRKASGIPAEWQPYADMFRIFDLGATRLTEGELETCVKRDGRRDNVRLGVWLRKWAAMLVFMLCIGALAATITYRAVVEPKGAAELSEAPGGAERAECSGVTDEEFGLPDSITFNNQPLAEIVRQITAIYGCKVALADSATAALRLYFTLPKGSTVADFVAIIDEYEALVATIQDDGAGSPANEGRSAKVICIRQREARQ